MITVTSSRRLISVLLVFGITTSRPLLAEDQHSFSAADIMWYEQHIKPVLDAYCLKCHGGKQTRSGFSITSRAAILRGGEAGPAVNLSKPLESLMVKMISYSDDNHQMPPKRKMPAETINLLTDWIVKGMPWTPETIHGAPGSDQAKP